MLLFSFFNPGFNTILNYIINYYSGVDTEVRDPRGFTALIKAGLQGREECVSALLMHGKQWWKLTSAFTQVEYSFGVLYLSSSISCYFTIQRQIFLLQHIYLTTLVTSDFADIF